MIRNTERPCGELTARRQIGHDRHIAAVTSKVSYPLGMQDGILMPFVEQVLQRSELMNKRHVAG